MSVKTFQSGSPSAQDTSRGPSMSIWKDFPIQEMQQSMSGGYGEGGCFIQDDFNLLATPSNVTPAIGLLGQWAAWAAASFTVVDGQEEGGVAKINGTAQNTSFILTSNSASFRFIGGSTAYNAVGGRFAMEFRIALGSIAAGQQGVFIGLADNTSSQINSGNTTIIASGANVLQASDASVTKNVIGFFNRCTTNPADWAFVYAPAGGAAVYPTGLATLVNTVTGSNMSAYAASTDVGKGTGFVKIGMVVDFSVDKPARVPPSTKPATQTAGRLYKPVIEFYVNGQLVPAFLDLATMQAATFPTNVVFCPVIAFMNEVNGGGGSTIYLDWVRFAQIASF